MSLELQLSEMRRSLDVSITKIDGQLTVLLQKSEWAEQRSRESSERMAAELAARDAKLAHFETRVDGQDERYAALKARVYFMSGVASTLGGAVGIVASFLIKR